MKRAKPRRERLLKRLACLLAATLLFVCLLGAILAEAASDAPVPPAWAAPNAMVLKRIGVIDTTQRQPNFLSNLDCDSMEYRLPGSDTKQTGCFARTAFGLMDADSETVVFNGTDEGLPLLPSSAHQVLVPWPMALGLLTLDAAPTGGSYANLYKNPLSVMRDQRDWLLKLTAKQLTAPPELPLEDGAGRPLVINPQTLAFSDSGSWLVAESSSGSFLRINLASLDPMAFAPSFGMSGSLALLKSQVAVSDNGHYVAIANDAASVLRVYDLTVCDGGQAQRCAFHDYMPFGKQQIAGLHGVRHLRFINDGILSFEALTDGSVNDGTYELAPVSSIGPLIDYLGLGDSYTSGEGAFDYLVGTDTADNMCHLSVNSYPLLLTRALYGGASGHSVACSGAVINDIGSSSAAYRGQARGVTPALESIMGGFTPGYVAQQKFVRQYQPGIVTVSIGGDDVGFGDMVRNCVAPHISLRLSDNDCYKTYEDRLEVTQLIDRTVARWTGLYRQLAAGAPGARIYVIGYPQIVADNGNCALNVHLSQSEREFAVELIDYLNNGIRQAAAKAGVTYVDISQSLDGHRLCEAASYDVAVNGLTAGKDGSVLGIRIFGKESYHPNALGQALMEQAVLRQTHNLAEPAGAVIDKDNSGILKAPRSGRKINTIIPERHLAAKVLRAGKSATVKARGVRSGLKARSTYAIRLGGASGRVIGTVTSDDNGDVSTSITLPLDSEAGGQTIDITGENQAGEPVDLTQPVYVAVNDTDADGDGIPDTSDSCPGAINSGQDIDRDGVDDTCDNYVSPPLAVGQGNDPSGGTAQNPSNNWSGLNGGTGNIGSGQSAVMIVTNLNGGSPAQALGSATVNPAAGTAAGLRPQVQTAAAQDKRPGRSLTRLPVINWLPWASLLAIAWLLVILGAVCARLADNRVRDEQLLHSR